MIISLLFALDFIAAGVAVAVFAVPLNVDASSPVFRGMVAAAVSQCYRSSSPQAQHKVYKLYIQAISCLATRP